MTIKLGKSKNGNCQECHMEIMERCILSDPSNVVEDRLGIPDGKPSVP